MCNFVSNWFWTKMFRKVAKDDIMYIYKGMNYVQLHLWQQSRHTQNVSNGLRHCAVVRVLSLPKTKKIASHSLLKRIKMLL